MKNYLLDVSYIIAVIIEIGLPIALAVFAWKKFKVSWAIFFLGMGLFIASLIRIPLNSYVTFYLQSKFSGEISFLITALFASLTAGIFEEGVRALAFGAIIKNRTYYKGIMYGIGHGGGGESMIFVGLSVLAGYVMYRFFPNILPQISLSQISSIAWYLPLVGALERIFAIAIQISLSVLVMYAFLNKKYYFIAVAIFYHMLIDITVMYVVQKSGIFLAETAAFIFAVIGIAIILLLKPKTNADRLAKNSI